MSRKTKTEINNRRKKVAIISSIVAGLLIIIGITFAWFYQHQKAVSLTQIAPPGKIIISGVHGSELDQIDLSYNSGDVDENGKVTVRNVICVDSEAKDVRLKLAHTTNVENLSLRIYPASEVDSQPQNTEEYVKGSDSGKDYYYIFDSKTGYTTKEPAGDKMQLMTCLNADENDKELAKQDGDYHNKTYGANEKRVQKQAEPLYWTSESKYTLPLDSKSTQNEHIKYAHYGYFVLEASWTEKEKETDIVYVTAE